MHHKPLKIALLGNPNSGKTSLFNALTGAKQKVANYAGVTVERKEGFLICPNQKEVNVLDLPGAYSLNAISADEAITRDVVLNSLMGEDAIDLLVCVVDACNLKLNLRLVLEVKALGVPMVLALNMVDAAKKRQIEIDKNKLADLLGIPVIETIAIQKTGCQTLVHYLQDYAVETPPKINHWQAPDIKQVMQTQQAVKRIMQLAVNLPKQDLRQDDAIDKWVLHPVWGMCILALTLFLMFQAVFSWAQWPMEWIDASVSALGTWVGGLLPQGILNSLLVDGIIAGLGGVIIFLPQILILFFFILILEESGYLPRAAFLLDRVMGSVGLSGRSFIPLLSSFACAIPGIMATRTITNWRDRLATIMIAPLMTCSARLPVYALIIGAFIPQKTVAGIFNLQGLTLFVLYFAGIISAMLVAWVMKKAKDKQTNHPLLLELPAYRWPNLRNLYLGLQQRAWIFLRRVGTIILSLTILLWFLSSFPHPPAGATGPAIQYSFAGILGRYLEPIFAPIGFNWQICIALIPGMAAREVAVGALGTVYALSASGDDVSQALSPLLHQQWSLGTAFALLAWFVYAPQCLATLAAVKRETNGWKYPFIMAGYLFALAYIAAGMTYHVTQWITGG